MTGRNWAAKSHRLTANLNTVTGSPVGERDSLRGGRVQRREEDLQAEVLGESGGDHMVEWSGHMDGLEPILMLSSCTAGSVYIL